MDLKDDESVENAVVETVEEFGGLDILVNNAGIPGPTSPIGETTIDDLETVLDVNLLGQVRTVKAALPHLKDSDAGRVINISSTASKDVIPSRAPYNTSKIGVIGLSRSLALDLGPHGITVNSVCPGATKGRRIEKSIEEQSEKMGLSYEETKERLFTGDAALGTLIERTDTAELVAFLASDRARYISGQDINVDAGSCWG